MGLIYTTIQHRFRKANGLSCNEYVLADMVYQLSVSPEAKIRGWCYMGRHKMADELGLSKQSILNLIDSLITKGFIERDEETSYLKTLRKWNVLYFTEGKESLPMGKESLPHAGKESLPYNNRLDNNSNNSLTKVNEALPAGNGQQSFFEKAFKQSAAKSEDKKKTRVRENFAVPDKKEVLNYFKDKGHQSQAAKFYNYYESKGWVVGRVKMKNWKAAANNWVLNIQEKEPPAESGEIVLK